MLLHRGRVDEAALLGCAQQPLSSYSPIFNPSLVSASCATGTSTSFVRKRASVNGGLKRCSSHAPAGSSPSSRIRRSNSWYRSRATGSWQPLQRPLNRIAAIALSGTSTSRTFGSVGAGASAALRYLDGSTNFMAAPGSEITGVVIATATDSEITGVVIAMAVGAEDEAAPRFVFSGFEKTPMYRANFMKLPSSPPPVPVVSTATAGA
mmetsp:Transcript_92318/g.296880  ORF Transcript_92318/g.296880 Transcript_92318/m.296880 type:complete len:208 (+) Transcript_92318:247-870(+)